MTQMAPQRKKRWPIILVLVGVVVFAGAWLLWNRHLRASAVAATLDWSRMNPPPPSAELAEWETAGNMFTRQFLLTYQVPPEALPPWLDSSPGIQDAEHETDGEWDVYHIRPGSRAAFAEVRARRKSGKVVIEAHWS